MLSLERRSRHAIRAPVVLAGLTLLALLCACAPPKPPPPSRVVLIVIDTLRADHLGLYGYERETSPTIDEWAEQAAVFDRAVSTSPWTLPTFGSIFTGQLPAVHGAGWRLPGKRWLRAGLRQDLPTLTERLRDHGLATAAIVNNPFLRPRFGLARGFDSYDYGTQRAAAKVVDRALSWIEEQGEQPYFLFVHFMDPHMPYRPPGWARGRFAADSHSPMPPMKQIRRRRGELTEVDRQLYRDLYDEEIAYLDAALGSLLEALEDDLQAGRLLVVITADHGEEFFDHDGFEHGHTMYQELLRVPLLIRGPGVTPRRYEKPVSVIDLMPTILDAVGFQGDETDDGAELERESLAGLSLWPALRDGRDLADRRLLAESMLYGKPQEALIDWPLKVVYKPVTQARHLFDLSVDPGETTDLAADRPAATDRLLAILDERRRSIDTKSGPEVPLDDETRDELEALGYL